MMRETTSSQRFLQQAAVIIALTGLVAAGCSGDNARGPTNSPSPSGQASEDRQSRNPSTAGRDLDRVQWGNGVDIRAELQTLARTPSGEAVVARIRLTSFQEEFHIRSLAMARKPNFSIDRTSLIDTRHRKRYWTLRAGNKCMCSTYDIGVDGDWKKGESQMLYAYFPAPPPGVDHVTVQLPLVNAFPNVPIGKLNQPAPLPTGQPKLRPSQYNTEPEIVPLTQHILDSDGASAVDQRGEETTVRLSAEVLFDLNKATLRPSARKELRETAKRIENADPKVVHVDGYTDSSGGPGINVPLSKNRAQAVQKQLKKLVDSKVRFEVQGHGSDNPIAPNDTAEGRQKNRRVSVTFKRTKDDSTGEPTSGSSSTRTSGTDGYYDTAPTPSTTPAPTNPPQGNVATATSKGIKVEVDRVVSQPDGFTVVYWTVTSKGGGSDGVLQMRSYFTQNYSPFVWYQTSYQYGLQVIVPDKDKRYATVTDPDGHCVCGKVEQPTHEDLTKGQSMRGWSAFYIPSDTKKITVNFPGKGRRLANIPVQ